MSFYGDENDEALKRETADAYMQGLREAATPDMEKCRVCKKWYDSESEESPDEGICSMDCFNRCFRELTCKRCEQGFFVHDPEQGTEYCSGACERDDLNDWMAS